MQSSVEFRFSHDIYTDSGAIYSPEYLAHRGNIKKEFLSRLHIDPYTQVSIENLTLTPDRAIVTLPLTE